MNSCPGHNWRWNAYPLKKQDKYREVCLLLKAVWSSTWNRKICSKCIPAYFARIVSLCSFPRTQDLFYTRTPRVLSGTPPQSCQHGFIPQLSDTGSDVFL